ncbi:MAG: glycosyltransferase family 4 protein [Dehalococcoidales bacterium]|jgi:phosphatidylinositol alpha-mannosyltransferase|nr:glycosyltransferase family 4 protein [Dehalococcoidales bacterium]
MKIALVSPYDFAFPGGVTSHISSLEIYLTRMGHEVKVIAPASREIKLFGDRFIPIGKPRSIPSSGSVIRIATSLHLAPVIKSVLEREKFDIIHLHEPFMPMLCSAILRFSNAVNIGTFHAWDGKPGYDWGKPVSTWMLKRRRQKLHGRIAVSNMAMRYARKYVPGDYMVIPNGIDVEQFKQDVKPIEQFCDGKKNILFFGRLERRKGGIYLMRAFEMLHKEMPDTRLIMAGPGTALRQVYEQWMKRHGLTEKEIVFTGYVSEEDKARYFKTADIYCSPATSRESFGIVLLEGMAAGKPVVASNIDGYNSVVTHGENGLLFPPKDSVHLAETLKTLLNDEELRNKLAESAKETVDSYRWDKIAQRVSDYYTKIYEEQKSG